MIDSKPYNKETYQNIIRRKFTMEDFNLKRNILLEGSDKLSELQLFERMINTLAFVHNSTVYLPSEGKRKAGILLSRLENSSKNGKADNIDLAQDGSTEAQYD